MKKVFFLFIMLNLNIVVTSDAKALCVLASIDSVAANWTFSGGTSGYDVFDTNEYMQNLTVTINSGLVITPPCTYFLGISTGLSADFDNRTLIETTNSLSYNIYTSADKSNILKDIPIATDDEIISGTFNLGGTQTANHDIFWTIPPLEFEVGLLSFSDTITMNLYAGVLGITEILVDTVVINVQAVIDSSIDLSIVDTGASFNLSDTSYTVNLNEIENNETSSFDIKIRSNLGYLLKLQSTQNGNLRHVNYPIISDEIQYDLEVDSSLVNLSTGTEVDVISQTTQDILDDLAANGMDTFNSSLTIRNFSGTESPGSYSDNISVTITAQ